MKKVIIGIHGLANKPPKESLEKWWKQSILEGLAKNCGLNNPKFDFKMVYWADLLYKYPLHDDQNFNFDKLYNTEPYIEAKPGALKKYKDSWKDAIRAKALDLAGLTLDKFKNDHPYVGVFADWALDKLLRDLAFYYDNGRKIKSRSGELELARKVLQDELKKALLENKDNDIMLIAHSMGTIISYDVLRDLGQSTEKIGISHFITIGSPLGLPHVKGKIIQERKYDPSVRTPSIVTNKWINFSDKKDPVAVDIHLRDDYAQNDNGIQVIDDVILNDYQKPSDNKNNHHKSYGYLRAPELSESIYGFIAES
ncbi:MAG: alpha/beta hydrolase [Candidatus Auribacterota bacterium]